MKALLVVLAVLCFATPALAQPTLGPDCGVVSTLMTGSSNTAGKFVIGTLANGNQVSSCTLTFTSAHHRACSASDETDGGGYSIALGTETTDTTMKTSGLYSLADGDVISYQCSTF